MRNSTTSTKPSKVYVWYLLILLFALLTSSSAQAQLPWLHVEGNTIRDASGNAVTLRGFSLLPNESNNECTTCNSKPISEMLAWQADASRGWYSRVVRIGVHQAFTNPAAAFANHIDPFVQQARALNLYVIVDLHLVSDYSVNGSPGITQAQVLAFWNYVAPRYANVPNVIFEIYNEPINPDNWTSWKNYIQPVVNAVRSAAPNNLILMGNPQWSTRVNEAVTNPITGGNIAYVYHIYPNQGDPNAANLNAKFGNAANSIPILITEFGWNQDPNYSDAITFGTTGGWGQTFRAYMDSRPHIGWVNYIFDNYWKPQIFDWNWNLLSGENQGTYIRDWLFETQKSNQAGGFVHGPQTAYTAHSFPGRVQAENFDNGEQDGAFHETTYDNQGGTAYRSTPVDIGTTADGGAGHIVGFINNGEWLEYTISNITTGSYNINLRTASADPATGKSITVKLGGVTLGSVTPANTGGWETYQTLTLNNVPVTGGSNKILRLEFGGSGYNFNWIEFVSTGGGNVAPTANAGADKSVNLPTNSVTLNGSGTDSDGTISTYAWTRVSGPNTPTMTGANTANLTASGLIAGTYVFRLTVTDNGGLTASDDATVIVSNGPSTNLALNKPATVSSVENSTFPGSYAVDGNAGTRWSSAFSDPQWIYVDLGATYDVNRVKIIWEAALGRDYLVQTGTGTSSWTTLRTITGNTATTNDHTGLSGTGRYIRIYGTVRGTIYGYSIFELEVYGTASSNTPPAVSITSPANGANFTAPANITINANASDVNGTISKVEFFNGTTKLGEDLTSPYSFNWSNVASGSYALTAKATDNGGASTTSSTVNITVSTVPPATKMFEAELLSYWSSGATSSITTDGTASGGQWIMLNSDGVGDFIEYTVNQTEGQVTYNVYLGFKSGPDRGTCQMYEDNTARGAVFDQFASTQIFKEVLVASNVTLYNGDRKFRFQLAGKNAGSSNYRLSQDYLKLVQTSTSTSSTARIATETETSTGSEENSNSIQLYPNPSSSTIQLNGLPDDAVRIAIFDMLGIEHIIVIPNKQRSIEVNVQKLSRGMYIVRVESTSKRWAKLKFFRE